MKVPLTSLICGYEKLSSKSISVVTIELDGKDLSKYYSEELKLSNLFEISSTKCPIEAYSIFKSKTE